MSLKVHQPDKLHSPHVHSLKAFPGVVLVNHFPPLIPENHSKSFVREMKGWLMLTRHFSAPGKPARLLPLSPSASASDRESTSLLLVIHHLQWSFLPCSSATSNGSISNHLLWFHVVVLLAEKTKNLVQFDQLLQSQLLILPALTQVLTFQIFRSFRLSKRNWTEWNCKKTFQCLDWTSVL